MSWICAGCRRRVPPQGAAAGCRCRVLLESAAVRVVCAVWSWPAGAAAGCCCRVRVACALWSWPVGAAAAAAGCRCRVLLQGAAVRVVCALWRWPTTGAVARFRCRVLLLLEWHVRAALVPAGCCYSGVGMLVLLQGAAVRVLCALSWRAGAAASGVCAVELACRCRCRVPLQGVAVVWRCRMLRQGAAVRLLCALWSWLASAAPGCRAAAVYRCSVRVQGTTVKGPVCILGTWVML